eukprot:513420_1
MHAISTILSSISISVNTLLHHNKAVIRKKTIMVIHKVYSLSPTFLSNIKYDLKQLLLDTNYSVINASLHLALTLIRDSTSGCNELMPSFISMLQTIMNDNISKYKDTCFWAQIKLLQILASLGCDNKSNSEQMYAVLFQIMTKEDITNNAIYAIKYECIRTITKIYPNEQLLNEAAKCISKMIIMGNSNIKYCGVIASKWLHNMDDTIKYLQLSPCNTQEISQCEHGARLIDIMHQCNKNASHDINHINVDHVNIDELVLNDYLHLLQKHNKDEDVEYICGKLTPCDVRKCTIFKRRNNRHKTCLSESDTEERKSKNANDQSSIEQQIFDKIHCYYTHCFDIGNRLLKKDKIFINTDKEEKMTENKNEISYVQYLTNKQMIRMHNVLSPKRQMSNTADAEFNHRIQTKYNQLMSEQKSDHEIEKQETKRFSFGIYFKYGHEPKTTNHFGVEVKPKHSTFKEEMLTNQLSEISANQFNDEYQKALKHFDSSFAKAISGTDCQGKFWIFDVQYVLALMIYCNFDKLQNEFSKTYRENNGTKHGNFYHLGRYLKIAINVFGTKIKENDTQKFYHGIGERLVFPYYIGNSTTNGGGATIWDLYHNEHTVDAIRINSPLSTSSQLTVATNFTNNNHGLIIQFTDAMEYAKYFSVSWLSDYGNESEYLFIQQDYHGALSIGNIIDVQMGTEYDSILDALRIIHQSINTCNDDTTLLLSEKIRKIPLHTQQLINRILSDQ